MAENQNPNLPSAGEEEAWSASRQGESEVHGLIVDVDGFSGPLDLLLELARAHKLDLSKISMLALAQQYLDFIAAAQRLRLELAADYLVMASWLAYLKSRLILPREEEGEEEADGETLAALLAFRLRRLDAMRKAAAGLMARDRLGRDVFARGMPEGVRTIRQSRYTATVYDFLKAYAAARQRTSVSRMTVGKREVWPIKEARARLEALLGFACDWAPLEGYLRQYLPAPELHRTALASSFGALLEMAREGVAELHQETHFGPLYVRRKASGEVVMKIV